MCSSCIYCVKDTASQENGGGGYKFISLHGFQPWQHIEISWYWVSSSGQLIRTPRNGALASHLYYSSLGSWRLQRQDD